MHSFERQVKDKTPAITSYMWGVRCKSLILSKHVPPNTSGAKHNKLWMGLADFSGLHELNTELNFFHKYRSTIYCKLITAGRLHYYTIKRKGLWQHG